VIDECVRVERDSHVHRRTPTVGIYWEFVLTYSVAHIDNRPVEGMRRGVRLRLVFDVHRMIIKINGNRRRQRFFYDIKSRYRLKSTYIYEHGVHYIYAEAAFVPIYHIYAIHVLTYVVRLIFFCFWKKNIHLHFSPHI